MSFRIKVPSTYIVLELHSFFVSESNHKMAVNFNQLLRRQSSREMVTRQFSRDVEARMEMNAMGDACHGRRIHYSGESFKIRQRSRSEVKFFLKSY